MVTRSSFAATLSKADPGDDAGGTRESDVGSAEERHREQQLVTRVRSGDRAAFDTLVLTYYADLRASAAVFLRSATIAEELVQDVFFRIWNIRETWTVQSSLRRYLFVAVRNAALVHVRRERMTARWESDVLERNEAPAMGRPVLTERRAEASEVADAFHRALDRLPARCREVAILRFERELSRAEVADLLGITVKAVEKQIARALRVLRIDLAQYLEP